jgi:fumarate hydratase subunit alpha
MITEVAFKKGIVELIKRAETKSPADYRRALQRCLHRESDALPRLQLSTMLRNLQLAEDLGRPICQDTGIFTFFIRLGEKLPFDLNKAIREAVLQAGREVPLRPHLVDPLTRKPSSAKRWQLPVYVELMKGSRLEVELLVKGAGTENYSRLYMLKPTAGIHELPKLLCNLLEEAGGKACPPVAVGIGIGGSPDSVFLLAKRALLRKLDRRNPGLAIRRLEAELEREANSLEIGPMGLGGKATVLRVLIEQAPCHTATTPMGIVLQCWPGRKGKAVLERGRLEVVEP